LFAGGARLVAGAGLDLATAVEGGCLVLPPFGPAALGGSGVGAAGLDGPTRTEIPNRRHCPVTGANRSSKFTCEGADGKKPAMCSIPLASICGIRLSWGSITDTAASTYFFGAAWFCAGVGPGIQLIVPIVPLPYCTKPVLVVAEWGAEIGK
jgi:hypothetical protein